MRADVWHDRFRAAMDMAEAACDAGGDIADNSQRLAFGFTNSVDRIVNLDGATLGALARDLNATPRPSTEPARTPAEFLAALLHYVRTGQGGEIWLGSPVVGRWLAATFQGRSQVGGTGIRGASTLAGLGFSTLLHVTTLPPEQAGLLDDSGRIAIPTAEGLRRPNEAVRAGDPVMLHVILEFQAGTTVPLRSETLVAPQANRVIVALDPANLRHPLDEHYLAAVADPARPIRWALISGYSQVTDARMLECRIAETQAAIARWRLKPEPPNIHLELGAMPDDAVLGLVLDRLAPAVDSVGLNADELAIVLALLGDTVQPGTIGTLAGLSSLDKRLGVPRLCLHSQHYCLTFTRADPAREQLALLYASLVAGTFARLADFPQPDDLRQALAGEPVDPIGLEVDRELADLIPGWRRGVGRLDDRWLVFAPTLATAHPATTIGLGDSFTAGVLALL